MKKNGLKDNHALQTYFNKCLLPTLTQYGKKMMGWDEIFQPGLPKDAVIHSWQGKKAMVEAAKQGYQTVLSNGYYIDLMEPTDKHYLNDPLPAGHGLTPEQAAHILGGEATMWSELVTPLTIDSRIWPRTAAIAERLWSAQELQDLGDMYRRLEITDLRLEELGCLHNAARERLMRSLCAGAETAPLRVLLDVSEPLKLYTRNPNGDLYVMYSPFTLFADAAKADAKVAREFRWAVDRYLDKPTQADKDFLLQHLHLWRDNHAQLLPILERSPALREIQDLSAHLSRIAAIGLAALEGYALTYDKNIFVAARQQGGRCELMVVDAIEKLANAKEKSE